jgi:hypothetical protein
VRYLPCVPAFGRFEDGCEVVLHAHDRPAPLVGFGQRVCGAVVVGEFALGVVMVD